MDRAADEDDIEFQEVFSVLDILVRHRVEDLDARAIPVFRKDVAPGGRGHINVPIRKPHEGIVLDDAVRLHPVPHQERSGVSVKVGPRDEYLDVPSVFQGVMIWLQVREMSFRVALEKEVSGSAPSVPRKALFERKVIQHRFRMVQNEPDLLRQSHPNPASDGVPSGPFGCFP